MKSVVLGGHGFVGKSLVEELRKAGHEAMPLSRRDGLDLADPAALRATLAREAPDVIFNCAAHVGSLHYVSANAADVVHDNVQMALHLYRAASEVCARTWIVNPLSNCSYPGDAQIHYEPDWWQGEVHESVFSYGNSKRMIYVTSACYAKQYGLKSLNFLVPNTFGIGDYTDPSRTHALNGMIIRMILSQRAGASEFEIWGTGAPVREWAYIKDVVRILVAGLDLDTDLIYPANIAQNHGHSIRESAEAISEAVGFEGKLTFNTDYQDGAPTKVLDDRRFRQLFPDYRFYDHRKAIEETVAYYREVL